MLFLQGERDQLADSSLMEQLHQSLGNRATLKLFPDADHSFHVPARSGRTDDQVMSTVLDALVAWISKLSMRPK
jgi:pimeloyl-ACP methyl ester carboxylesterase